MPKSETPHRQHRVRSNTSRYDLGALAQHCLVEHALCAVDPKQSLVNGYIHDASYLFQDKNRNLKKANVRVACPFGLSPNDELFLWGLLHLVFSQEDPTPEFVATPHFCLKQVGIVDAKASQGKRYEIFRQAIRRIAGVVYQNDNFYDPIRGEHRDVAFGFLKYSLPIDPHSSRAWRFVFDQQFFEFCHAIRGSFQFDLDTYRQLDFASRRLFLFLTKVFWRKQSVNLDLHHLAVNVLGFSADVPLKNLKVKVMRSTGRLLDAEIIQLADGASSIEEILCKRAKGKWNIAFHRGPYFDQTRDVARPSLLADSPNYDPLKTIGFDDFAIRRIVAKYKPRIIQEWTDITLAAKERKLINKDPKAYFNYYIERAANKETTPPDWWIDLRKREERRRFEEQRSVSPLITDALCAGRSFDDAFEAFLESEVKQAFEQTVNDLSGQFEKAGKSHHEAEVSAEKFARQHFRNRFLKDHPEYKEPA